MRVSHQIRMECPTQWAKPKRYNRSDSAVVRVYDTAGIFN